MGILDQLGRFLGLTPTPAFAPTENLDTGEPIFSRALSTRASLPSAASAVSTLMRSDRPTPKGAKEVLDYYCTNPHARSAFGRIAGSVASHRWHAYAGTPDNRSGRHRSIPDHVRALPPVRRHRGMRAAMRDGEVKEVFNHPLVDLLARPNEFMNGREALMMTVAGYQLIGLTCWILNGENGEPPTEALPVPGTWVTHLPSPDQPWWEFQLGSNRWTFPMEKVLKFKDVNPGNPYGAGCGVGQAVGDEIDIDEHSAKMLSAWFSNGGLPDAIISVKGAPQGVLDRMKRQFNNHFQGFKKKYKNHWTNGEIDVKRLDTSFKDMQLSQLRKDQRDVIQEATHSPPEKMGIVTNSNKATALAASIIDATDVQIPILEVLREEFQRLAEMYDERLFVEYDNPVPPDVEAQRLGMASHPYAFSIDDIRETYDLESWGDDRGGKGVVVNGVWYANPMEIGNGLDAMPTPPEPETPAPEEPIDEPDDGPKPPADEVPVDEPIDVDDPVDVEVEKADTASTRNHVTEGQIRKIVAAVRIDEMFDELEEPIRELIDEFGSDTFKNIGDKTVFDDDSARIRKAMRTLKKKRVGKYINATTRAELTDAIRAAAKEAANELSGKTMTREETNVFARAKIVEAITSVFSRARVSRAPAISTNESVLHSQLAVNEAMHQTELDVRKGWLSQRDEKVRDSHAALDIAASGQRPTPDEEFVIPAGQNNAGARAMQPMGFGIPEEDIGCRCFLGTFVEEKTKKGAQPRVRTPEELEQMWRSIDARLRPWEKDLEDAVVRGFNAQEAVVLEAVEEVLET